MKKSLRIAANACLFTAASGLFVSQSQLLFSQDQSGASSADQGATQTNATSDDSDVQRELQKLYRKNRREMPSFQISDAPHTEGATPANPNGQPSAGAPGMGAPPAAAAKSAAAPASKAAKPNWFERTFHVGRGKKKPAPIAESPARVAPNRLANPYAPSRTMTPQTQQSQQSLAQTPRYQAPPTGQAPSLTAPPVGSGSSAAALPAQPALREPAPLTPSPLARELTSEARQPAALVAKSKAAASDLLEESDLNDDKEDLSLDADEGKAKAEPESKLASRDEDDADEPSPYSGLKIAPNQVEQKAAGSDSLLDDEEDEDDADDDDQPAQKAAAKSSAPAADEPAPAKSAEPVKRNGLAPIDESADDDDDDAPSTPAKPRQLSEPAVLKAAKVLEKLNAPAAPAAKSDVADDDSSDQPQTEELSPPALFPGFKGICPVALKDSRKLVDASPEFVSTYKGKNYTFSSAEAKKSFDENPRKYAPVSSGADVVKLTGGEKESVGSIEHAAWFRGRLYLFSSEESRIEFVDAPSKFVVEE